MNFGDDDQDNGARGRFGQTSDFSTTTISKDGTFFGVKLSPQNAQTLNMIFGTLRGWASNKGGEIVAPKAEKFAHKFIHKDDLHKAAKFGNRAGDIAAYTIIFGKEAIEIGTTVYNSTQELNDLRKAVKPLANSGTAHSSISPLSGDNEVVANARGKIKDIFTKRLMGTFIGAVSAIPAFWERVSQQAHLNEARVDKQSLEIARKDSETLADYHENKTAGRKSTNHDVDYRKIEEETLTKIFQRREAKYNEFKSAREKEVKSSIEKVLKMPAKNVVHSLSELQEHGIDISGIERTLQHRELSEADLQHFLDTNKQYIPRIVEKKLRTDFDEKFGKFDRHKVLREINGEWGGEEHRSHKNNREDNSQESELARTSKSFAATLASEVLKEKLIGKKYEKYSQPIALDRILHLRRVMDQAHPPEQVPNIGGNGDVSYTRYVHDIFQQHQRDLGRPEIGERYFENFEKARWDDNAILQLPDDQLNPYEHAIKTIAKRIEDGRMDAIALIDLVGDRHKKIVRSDGRSFGPLGAGKDDNAIKNAINKIIDEKTALLRADQKQTDAEFNEKLGGFTFSLGDLKQALESKDMDPAHRAFVFAVFSEVVGSDEKLVKKLGISKEQVTALRKEVNAQFTDMMDAAVVTLAEMLEKDPEGLKKLLKITEKEQQLIISMAENVNSNAKHVVDVTENRDDRKALETVVANAAMAFDKGQDAKPEGFWQKLVSATKSLAQARADKAENKPADINSKDNASESKVQELAQGMDDAADGFASKTRRHAGAERFKQEDDYRHRHKNGKGEASAEVQAL